MRSTIVLVFGLLFYLCVGCADMVTHKQTASQKAKSDLALQELTGNVRSDTECDYKFNDDSGSNKWQLTEKIVYNFDQKGYETGTLRFDANGNFDRRWVYDYDEKMKKTGLTVYGAKDSLISKFTYRNDANGNCIESDSYDAQHIMTGKTTYKCDEAGNKLEERSFDSEGKLKSRTTYSYDKDGNTLETGDYSVNDLLSFRITYTYDGSGNVKTSTFYFGASPARTYIHTREQPDTHGNWTKSVIGKENDSSSRRSVIRSIAYY